MPEQILNLAGGYYKSGSRFLLNRESVNFIPHIIESPGGTSPSALVTEGVELWVDSGGGAGRGRITFQDEEHFVQGTEFKKISANGTVTDLGTITGISKCMLAENGNTVTIIDPTGTGYFYGTDIGLLEITEANFPGNGGIFQGFGQVTGVVEKDGYFVYTTDDLFFISSPSDVNFGRNFNAADSSTAEISTDKIVRPFVVHNELYLAGTRTIEVYSLIDTSDFPFQRINGAHVELGLLSRYGVVNMDNSYFYLAGNEFESPAIRRGISGASQKISSAAIDTLLNKYTQAELQTVQSWTYSYNGSFFAGWNLPDTTIVYDANASAFGQRPVWHERRTSGSKWRFNETFSGYGMILVQDSTSGLIGQISKDVFTELGDTVTRFFTTQYIDNSGKQFSNTHLELFYEHNTSTEYLPQASVLLEISDDGGETFQSCGSRSLGTPLDKNNRLIWDRLGNIENSRMYRFTISEPIKVTFSKIKVDIS